MPVLIENIRNRARRRQERRKREERSRGANNYEDGRDRSSASISRRTELAPTAIRFTRYVTNANSCGILNFACDGKIPHVSLRSLDASSGRVFYRGRVNRTARDDRQDVSKRLRTRCVRGVLSIAAYDAIRSTLERDSRNRQRREYVARSRQRASPSATRTIGGGASTYASDEE